MPLGHPAPLPGHRKPGPVRGFFCACAFLAASCVGDSPIGAIEVIGTGEVVRIVAMDGEDSISGENTLCVEVMPPTNTTNEPDYASISDLVSSKNLFDGWSHVQIRTHEGVDQNTLIDLSKAAIDSGDRDILFISWSCPD